MKDYATMKDGERQMCEQCKLSRERSDWFLKGECCDLCVIGGKKHDKGSN